MRQCTVWLVCVAAVAAFGCTNAEDLGVGRRNLGTCPAGIHPGMECDAALDIGCEIDGLLCWCEADADGRGRVTCEDHDVPPTDECTPEDLARCEMGDAVECSLEGRVCRCGTTDDGVPYRYCDEPPPPSPDGCTTDHIARCLGGERTECVHDDGRVCACYPTDRGAEMFCVEPSDVDPCTDEHVSRCIDGESLECSYGGAVCGCYTTPDGGIRFHCDGGGPGPGGTRECTPEDEMRCAAGEYVECERDGRRCACAEDAAGRDGGLWCDDEPPPPPPHDYCSPEDHAACADGADLSCLSMSGELCHCVGGTDPAGGGTIVCPDTTAPGDACTMEDYARCAGGGEVSCVGPDGAYCRCGSDGAGTDRSLICG